LEKDLGALDEVWEKHGPFNVVIYDPVYKLLGELDENKANDVAKLLRRIDTVGRMRRVASVMIHHYAKGDAWAKRAGDRASGSGVFLRDPDTYMAITELGEENSGTARVDCRLRCAPFVASFGIRWDNYQWQNDPTVEISKKPKEPKEPKEPNKQDLMIQILRDNPNGMTNIQWKNAVVSKQLATEGYFDRAVGILREKKRFRQAGRLYFAE
jgi:RecA-family ATPase